MTRPALLCVLLLCGAGAASAAKPTPPKDPAAFAHFALDAPNCRSEFTDQVQDRAWLDALKSLGITLNSEWQEGDVPEGEFVLPAGIDFGGKKVTRLKYWADSGAEFYALVDAPPEAVAKALGTKPVPESERGDFAEPTFGFRAARAAAKDERRAPGIFVRKAQKGRGTEAGCRWFDG